MGSLGLIMYDAVKVVLSGEPGMLSDSIVESCHMEGLSTTSSSSVTGVVSAS